MQPLVSLDEQEAHTFSDLRRVLEEQQEVHHLLVLMDRVLEFHDCAVWVLWIVITLEFVEVRGLGSVTVSMAEAVRVVAWRMRRVPQVSPQLLMQMDDL